GLLPLELTQAEERFRHVRRRLRRLGHEFEEESHGLAPQLLQRLRITLDAVIDLAFESRAEALRDLQAHAPLALRLRRGVGLLLHGGPRNLAELSLTPRLHLRARARPARR